MGGPLSRFIHKTSEQEIDTTGLVDDGSKPLPKITPKLCPEKPAYTIFSPAPSQIDIKAYQVDRLCQEIEHQYQLIRDAQEECKALERQRDKIRLGLDNNKIDDILKEAAKIKLARDGRNKPPDEPLELDIE